MKTIKTIMLAVAGLAASQLFGGYVFSWTLTGAPMSYEYAQIAVYDGGAEAGYLYFNPSTSTPSKYYATYSDSGLAAAADVSAIVAAHDAGTASYTFAIELFNNSGVSIALSDTYVYDMILAAQYLDKNGTTEAPSGQVNNIAYASAIPEPTSALLLLMGLGLLGLKRKARKVLVPCLLVAALTGFGEADLKFVTLKSAGPDKYADGTVVQDGERYAVVYTADPASVTFAADGQVTGGTLILTSRLAKNGGCPETSFQLGAAATAGCTGGEYTLFLLDTRLADGTIAAAVNGKVPLVNGYAPVAGGEVKVVASLVPEGTPDPVFTGIDVGDEWVTLTLEKTVPYLQYTVDDAEAAANGDASRPITLRVPRKDGGQTFKARRKGDE